MPLSEEDALYFINQPKRLQLPHQWEVKEPRDSRTSRDREERPRTPGHYELLAPVTIGGAQPRGLRFRATFYPHRQDRGKFQLECSHVPSRGKTVHALYRFEWHPVQPHSNHLNHPNPELRGLMFEEGETHEHLCLDHLRSDGFVKNGDVHAARKVLIDPADFRDALTYVCVRINIENGEDIKLPKFQGSLF